MENLNVSIMQSSANDWKNAVNISPPPPTPSEEVLGALEAALSTASEESREELRKAMELLIRTRPRSFRGLTGFGAAVFETMYDEVEGDIDLLAANI